MSAIMQPKRIGSHVYVPPHEFTNVLSAPEVTESSKGVNSLLHSLRGEQYRHARNLSRAKGSQSEANPSGRNFMTLPSTLDYSELHGEERPVRTRTGRFVPPSSDPTTAGPVPKSWRKPTKAEKPTLEGSAWRAEALSLIFHHLPDSSGLTSHILRDTLPPSSHRPPPSSRVPPLSFFCFRVLLSLYTNTSDFEDELVPYLAPHMRRDLLRYTSIYSPLSNAELYTLCEEGHADGELIVVGPHSSLRSNLWCDTLSAVQDEEEDKEEEDSSWDAASPYDASDSPLQTLILFNAALSIPTLLTLPPTITHLALLALPSSVPLHRLPSICPLLVVLDLSYNAWIGREGVGEQALKRVEWGRLRRLEVLGLRGCKVQKGHLEGLNKGRWEDVMVVLDSRP
ncbi:hypothetical protein OE88DRAFT_1805261 [Heliocybe sulcata]|uniref:Uncharacterized protein n=1 Tax=Heliocybe sulcata TaxID=5364 RepID=A0A5C3NMH8_9AGAM|nr:hypothetical protein OE88DRAFT_1805261 [Heliocybe sulcata]